MQDAVAALPIFCGGGRCVLKLLRSNNITHCTSIFDCACTFTITIISHCTAVHAKDMGSLLYYAFLCLFYSRIVVLICRSFAGLGLAGLAGQPPPMATVAANQPAVPLSHVNEPATIRTSQRCCYNQRLPAVGCSRARVPDEGRRLHQLTMR